MKMLWSIPLALIMLFAFLPGAYGEGSSRGNGKPKGDFVRGARLWKDNCGRCHRLRDPKDFRDDQWDVTLSHMRVRAGLTGQDIRDIAAFIKQSNN